MSEEIERDEDQPEVEAQDAPQIDPEAEAEARKYGWKPKEEFTLAPEGWVAADRFLELPSTQVKMSRDLTRRLEKDLKARDDEIARISATTAEALGLVRKQERARYEEMLAQFEVAKRQAAEGGDVARYDALTRQQQTIRPPEPEQTEAPKRPAFVEEYAKTAAWMQDQNAVAFARAAIDDNREVMRLPPEKQIAWAEKRVREYFPEHFPAPEQPKPQFSKVDGGGMGAIGKRGKGADDLPAEARKIAQEFVDEGVFKSLDEYAASYFAQEKRA